MYDCIHGCTSHLIGKTGSGLLNVVVVSLSVAAPPAPPGKTDTAIGPAASHNLFTLPCMLCSLVIVNLVLKWADCTPGPAVRATAPPSRASTTHAFSNASDSASLGSRS